MSIPSLKTLCAQKIVSDHNLYDASLRANLPYGVLNIVKAAAVESTWRWCESSETNTAESTFDLAPKQYKDFTLLCPAYQVKEEEFAPCLNQKNHEVSSIEEVVEFVREKGSIAGSSMEICSLSLERHQRFISLNYHIPDIERATSRGFVEIAGLSLPYKARQTVRVTMTSLAEINKNVKTPWSQETYKRVRDFAIYYVNQLAIDNSDRGVFSYCSLTTDNRLYLAKVAKDDEEAKEFLFGKYDGPSHWLLQHD